MLYREKNYLAHYGVKGMRWGHRKQYKDSVRSARQRMYDRQDKAENWHENKVMSINNKYKQYGNNLAGKNARMDRKTKKAYNNEVNKAWDKYSNEHDKATKQFKSDKKQAKAVYKQSEANRKQSDEYKAKRAKVLKTGAAVVGTALAAYGAYRLHNFVREKNMDIRINEGRAKCDRMLKKLDRIETKDWATTGGPTKSWVKNTNTTRGGFQYNHNGEVIRLAREHRKTSPTLKDEQYRNIERKIMQKTARDAINKAENDSFRTAAKNVSKYYLEEVKRKARNR